MSLDIRTPPHRWPICEHGGRDTSGVPGELGADGRSGPPDPPALSDDLTAVGNLAGWLVPLTGWQGARGGEGRRVRRVRGGPLPRAAAGRGDADRRERARPGSRPIHARPV